MIIFAFFVWIELKIILNRKDIRPLKEVIIGLKPHKHIWSNIADEDGYHSCTHFGCNYVASENFAWPRKMEDGTVIDRKTN